GEDHRRDGQRPEARLPIIERLGASPDRPGKIALMIPGCLAVSLEPLDKALESRLDLRHGQGLGHDRRWGCPDGSASFAMTRKLSTRLKTRTDFRMTFSFRISSFRWKRMRSFEIGRLMRRTPAHAYPRPKAKPSARYGRFDIRYAT